MHENTSEDTSFFPRERILNSQSVEEAAVVIQLFWEFSSSLSHPSQAPLNWSWDHPLCQRCWQEFAVTNELCLLCREILDRIQITNISARSGILVSCPYVEEISNTLAYSTQTFYALLSSRELLVLLPNTNVADFLLSLEKYTANQLTAIVFPAQGDMNFGDSLAMARYFSANAESFENGIWIKFFYSHAHMRSFDFDKFLSFEIAERLFQAAEVVKQVFNPRDRSIILNLLQKNAINRSYELSRFYSMCNQDQKSVLDQIQIDKLDPHRVSLLLGLTKHVSRTD